jgi:hypothetical protein
MAFLLPSEFRAPTDEEAYSDFDELEYEDCSLDQESVNRNC